MKGVRGEHEEMQGSARKCRGARGNAGEHEEMRRECEETQREHEGAQGERRPAR